MIKISDNTKNILIRLRNNKEDDAASKKMLGRCQEKM